MPVLTAGDAIVLFIAITILLAWCEAAKEW